MFFLEGETHANQIWPTLRKSYSISTLSKTLKHPRNNAVPAGIGLLTMKGIGFLIKEGIGLLIMEGIGLLILRGIGLWIMKNRVIDYGGNRVID